jgi:hypothetical protein
VDFLLECIGFPPQTDLDALVERIAREGEPAPWRGPGESHLRLPLGAGLELRLDRDDPRSPWSLLPHYQSPHRLRVAVESVRGVPDSRFDALVTGWADPPGAWPREDGAAGAYRLCAWLVDARRLPLDLAPGNVLALSLAGFALDVAYVGPDEGARDPAILEREHGAWVEPLGGADDPGGCSEVSLRVREVHHLRNPASGEDVELVVAAAPGRPLELFVSRWQLERDGLPTPRPGWRIEGGFLLSGRVAGGLPGPARSLGRAFG